MRENLTAIAKNFMELQETQQNINLKMMQVLVDLANSIPVDTRYKFGENLQNVLDDIIAHQATQAILFESITTEMMQTSDER